MLNQIVREAEHFRAAEERVGSLPCRPAMAWHWFFTTRHKRRWNAPLISSAASEHPELKLRMGIHSGPVSGVVDVVAAQTLRELESTSRSA